MAVVGSPPNSHHRPAWNKTVGSMIRNASRPRTACDPTMDAPSSSNNLGGPADAISGRTYRVPWLSTMKG